MTFVQNVLSIFSSVWGVDISPLVLILWAWNFSFVVYPTSPICQLPGIHCNSFICICSVDNKPNDDFREKRTSSLAFDHAWSLFEADVGQTRCCKIDERRGQGRTTFTRCSCTILQTVIMLLRRLGIIHVVFMSSASKFCRDIPSLDNNSSLTAKDRISGRFVAYHDDGIL